jgi:hypothetical protein
MASRRRLRFELFGQRAGPIDLMLPHEEPGHVETRAFPPVEREAQALLDLCTPLEQTRRDLSTPRLGLSQPRNHRHEQLGISCALGPLERCPGIDQRRSHVSGHQVDPGSEGQDPCLPDVVTGCVHERLVAQGDERRGVASYREHAGQQDVGPLDAGGNLLE